MPNSDICLFIYAAHFYLQKQFFYIGHLFYYKNLIQTANGSIFITTHQDDTSYIYNRLRNQIACFRLDEQGNKVWGKKYIIPQYSGYSNKIIETPDHNILISGFLSGGFDPSAPLLNGTFLMKIDANTGNVLWMKRYHNDDNSNIFFTSNGSILADSYDYLHRFDKNGIPLPNSNQASDNSWQANDKCRNDSIFSIGYGYKFNTLTIKDTLGNLLFHRAFPKDNDEFFTKFNFTADKGIIAATNSYTEDVDRNKWFIKKYNANFVGTCAYYDTICTQTSMNNLPVYENMVIPATYNLNITNETLEVVATQSTTEDYCIPLPPIPSPHFAVPQRTCAGACITISNLQNATADNWQWTFTDTTSTLVNPGDICFQNMGNFPISQTINFLGCPKTFRDTVEVVGFNADLIRDTTLCNPAPVTFTLPTANIYTWENNTTAPIRTVTAAATYRLTVTDGICTGQDTAKVVFVSQIIPPILVKSDTFFCQNSQLLLTPNSPILMNYAWQNIAVQTPITATGNYIVTATVQNCAFTDTIHVTEIVAPLHILPFTDTTICGNAIQLNATNPIFTHYNWSNGSTNPIVNITDANIYTVTASIATCSFSESINIKTAPDCTADIYIPNIFSPNNDTHNDYFEVFGKNMTIIRLIIADRYGEIVFSSTDAQPKWDGMLKNKELPANVYAFQLVYTNNLTGKTIAQTGDITLLR